MAPQRRREFLSMFGGGLVVAGSGLLVPRTALASDLSLSDRIDLLYSNQFAFNDRGEPQMTVGVMEGQDQVLLHSSGAIHALPSGDGGTSIEGGPRWRIRLLSSQPSQQRFRVALEGIPAADRQGIERATRRWEALGYDVVEREVGALFGVQGRVLDTRRTLLTTGNFSSEEDAQRQARVSSQRHGALGRLYPEIERRASGRLEAVDLVHGVKIRAEGVLWFAPAEGGTLTVRDVLHNTTMGTPGREDRKYRGQIYVAIDRNGKLAVVNLVSESDMLSGIVPAEIFASGPHEALRAQAVAARGQLLTKMGTRHLDDPYLLCAHQHCQVYAGVDREHSRTNLAVRATVGSVLLRPSGKLLVDTVYSANSGGFTEDNDVVWPSAPDPQLRGHADPLLPQKYRGGIHRDNIVKWLRTSPRSHSLPQSERLRTAYRWTAHVDPTTMAGRPGIPKTLGRVRKLEILKRGRSGRASAMRVYGANGEIDVHGELTIRRALGGLKSSMFILEPSTDAQGRFVLHGGGHGHGVGMCQHGALGMANAGLTHRQILGHYYTGSKLQKLW